MDKKSFFKENMGKICSFLGL